MGTDWTPGCSVGSAGRMVNSSFGTGDLQTNRGTAAVADCRKGN